MRYVTYCPSCGTAFKIVDDQLRIAQGWVRCGQCQAVYKAEETLSVLKEEESAATEQQPIPVTPAASIPHKTDSVSAPPISRPHPLRLNNSPLRQSQWQRQQRQRKQMKRRPKNRRITHPRQQTASPNLHLPKQKQTICWRASPPLWPQKKPPCNKPKTPKRATKPALQRQLPAPNHRLLLHPRLQHPRPRPCNRQRLKRLRLPQRPSLRSAHLLPTKPAARRITILRLMQPRLMG